MRRRVPEVVLDYPFLGVGVRLGHGGRSGDHWVRRTTMLLAHVEPAKGLAHEHGAQELINDIHKLAYQEVVLKYKGGFRFASCRKW